METYRKTIIILSVSAFCSLGVRGDATGSRDKHAGPLGLVRAVNADVQAQGASDYAVEWFHVASGGTSRSTAQGLELTGTIGQTCAGYIQGASIELATGMWDPFLLGDLDGDGDFDLLDHAVLEQCISGPGAVPENTCVGADLDGNGTVDLRDVRLEQLGFTGTSEG